MPEKTTTQDYRYIKFSGKDTERMVELHLTRQKVLEAAEFFQDELTEGVTGSSLIQKLEERARDFELAEMSPAFNMLLQVKPTVFMTIAEIQSSKKTLGK